MRRLSLLLAVALSACAPVLPRPTAADATRAGKPLEQLAQGRDLYANKCSTCHPVVAPESRRASAWLEPIEDMSERAHIGIEEREAILLYLGAFAKR